MFTTTICLKINAILITNYGILSFDIYFLNTIDPTWSVDWILLSGLEDTSSWGIQGFPGTWMDWNSQILTGIQ